MGWFGKPGKAGKAQRAQTAPANAGGAQSGGNVIPDAGIRYGRDPIAASYAARLGIMTSLTSPATAGRFRTGDQGSASNRATADLGALQLFRSLVGGGGRARVGAQAGPSSQPGYPSTNNTVLIGLAAMDQPGLQRLGGLR